MSHLHLVRADEEWLPPSPVVEEVLTPRNRRTLGRVAVDTMYSEYIGERQTIGRILNVSESGLRVQRLIKRAGQASTKVVQLEFELPGTGEMIWAAGETCFDAMWRVPVERGTEYPAPLLRTSGIRLVAAADRHLRLVRDYVHEARRDAQAQIRRLMLEHAMGRAPDEQTATASYWSITPPWVISPTMLARVA